MARLAMMLVEGAPTRDVAEVEVVMAAARRKAGASEARRDIMIQWRMLAIDEAVLLLADCEGLEEECLSCGDEFFVTMTENVICHLYKPISREIAY